MFADVRIDRDGLPADEMSAAWVIECNIGYMEGAVREFANTVQLYLSAYHRRQKLNPVRDQAEIQGMSSWIGIAGRNGAILVSSIADVMEDTKSLNAPVLWSRTDTKRRRWAFKRVTQEFPDIRRIRDSAAHPGELSATPEELRKHVVQGTVDAPASWFTQHLWEAFDDRLIYHSSFSGKRVEYELSLHKAQVLDDIVREFSWAILLPDVRPPPGFLRGTGESPAQLTAANSGSRE